MPTRPNNDTYDLLLSRDQGKQATIRVSFVPRPKTEANNQTPYVGGLR